MKPEKNKAVFLLVEDDPNDAFLVEREFAKANQTVRLQVVNDGQEAVHYLKGEGQYSDRDAHPMPNLLLLDLKMPRLGGFEFLKWLRSKSAENTRLIPVVVLSSSHLEEDVERAYNLGANSYMVKPLNWDEFRKLLVDLGIYWTKHALTPQFR
jgi:CheY-like chemotaxis protein